jgi:hypothetical protein
MPRIHCNLTRTNHFNDYRFHVLIAELFSVKDKLFIMYSTSVIRVDTDTTVE